MRIAYILDEDIAIQSGVVQKIGVKVKLWMGEGHTVKVISLRSSSHIPVIPDAEVVSIRTEVNLFTKFLRHFKNIRTLRKILQGYIPDIIYCRHIKYSPGLVKSLRSSGRYVVEVNTNDRKEFMLINPKVGLYNKLSRNVLYRSCSGMVAVTRELATDPDFTKFRKPSVTIANGVLGSNEELPAKIHGARFKVGFIGTPGQPWHGLDKVILLAAELPEHDFFIIGSSEEDIKKDKFISSLPSNVRLEGYLSKEASMKVLRQCDVGISTLALDRKGLSEASPLKTREYMLLGLPVIVGYKDTDLNEESAFLLNIGIGEKNVTTHMDEISGFISNSRNLDEKDIREYARKKFDSREKESRRLKFLMEIASNE